MPALIINPKVLLLDEPFSALDKNLRASMQIELREIQRNLGVTTIFVTHDQSEALSFSDRIVIMAEGRTVRSVLRKRSIQIRASVLSPPSSATLTWCAGNWCVSKSSRAMVEVGARAHDCAGGYGARRCGVHAS